jgi:hypothetical protein
MVKIAFWDNGLGERGTTVSLYDYAHFNETLLGNESIVLYNTTHYSNKESVIKRFADRFKVYGVDSWNYVDNILTSENCDILYIIKAGAWDGQISNVCKTAVHCVFTCCNPHGNVYSSLAGLLPHNNGKFPVVPFMVNLPDHNRNMREKLGIPKDAIVYGRHGGYNEFDIEYVHRVVYEVAKKNKNIYFLFVNTKPFCENLPNIIHHPVIVDLDEKTEFINTCDAMLWGRSGGETFGLAIGEFSSKNKPVICTHCDNPYANCHIYLLKDKAIWYNENVLEDILIKFDKNEIAKQDWNAYKEYTPEKVMQIFKKVYIDN